MFETTASEIDDFDCALSWVFEENVLQYEDSKSDPQIPSPWEHLSAHLGFEIAVNDAMMTKEGERSEDLHGKATNEGRRESSKTVRLDEFVEIDAEQLGDDAEMSSERERVDHSNDKVFLVGILPARIQLEVRSELKEENQGRLTHLTRFSSTLISTRAW